MIIFEFIKISYILLQKISSTLSCEHYKTTILNVTTNFMECSKNYQKLNKLKIPFLLTLQYFFPQPFKNSSLPMPPYDSANRLSCAQSWKFVFWWFVPRVHHCCNAIWLATIWVEYHERATFHSCGRPENHKNLFNFSRFTYFSICYSHCWSVFFALEVGNWLGCDVQITVFLDVTLISLLLDNLELFFQCFGVKVFGVGIFKPGNFWCFKLETFLILKFNQFYAIPAFN